MLDTAESYHNEEAVGRAIKASGVPRDELFVTTKIFIQSNGEKTTQRTPGWESTSRSRSASDIATGTSSIASTRRS